jgi:predicted membrane protein
MRVLCSVAGLWLGLVACVARAEERALPSVDLDAQYTALHAPKRARSLRMLGEELAFLGVGTSWYWLARKQNLFDWDRPSLKQRFTFEAMRFDNNKFPINFVWHPLSGAAYYAAPRTNGFSMWASSAVALGACVAWEYGIEFREKVSINDLIFTPLPAISVGEFYSRLALYLNRSPVRFGPVRKAFAYSFGFMQAGHDALDGTSTYVADEADALGYAAGMAHRFEVSTGYGAQSTPAGSKSLLELRMDGEFIAIPRYGRPGKLRRFLHDGDLSRFGIHTAFGDAGQELDVHNDLTLLGYFQQHIDDDARGHALFFGTSLGYRYRKLRFAGFSDALAITRLPGLALDALLRWADVAMHLRMRSHPEFAGVRSLAYPAYRAAHLDVMAKTTLDRDGYLYAFGASLDVGLDLDLAEYGSLGARVQLVYLNSKEGLDRNQEELTADPRGVERALDAEGFVRVYPLGRARRLMVELALLTRRRDSRLGGARTELSLLRGALRAGAEF